MTKILSVFNQCGGVAKTTLTQNLGYHLAQRQNRVLLIDLDPQASLTTFMGLDPERQEKNIYHALVENEPLAIVKNLHGLSFTPANIQLSAAEKQLVSVVMRELRLKNAISPLLNEYDFIFMDCPPSLGILSILSLVASTHVLVPIQTQSKAFEGTDLLLRTVAEIKQLANPLLAFAGFVPTLYDKRTIHQSQTYQAINSQLSPLGTVYEPLVHSIAFADASLRRVPLALYRPNHPAVSVLKNIAQQLESL
jgi:chromosome partitioning protein